MQVFATDPRSHTVTQTQNEQKWKKAHATYAITIKPNYKTHILDSNRKELTILG